MTREEMKKLEREEDNLKMQIIALQTKLKELRKKYNKDNQGNNNGKDRI